MIGDRCVRLSFVNLQMIHFTSRGLTNQILAAYLKKTVVSSITFFNVSAKVIILSIIMEVTYDIYYYLIIMILKYLYVLLIGGQ